MVTFKRILLITCASLCLLVSHLFAAGEDTFETAKTAYDNKQFPRSIQLFNQYIEENPGGQQLAASYYYLAELEEDFSTAQAYYLKIIDILPPSSFIDDAYYRLGATHYLLGNYESAAEDFSTLLRIFPTSPWADQAQYHLGKTWLALSQTAKAKTAFTQIITEYQGSQLIAPAILGLVDCLKLDNMHTEAIKELQEFEKNYPRSDLLNLAYFKTAESYRMLGDNGQAVAYYQKLIAQFPDSFEAEEAQKRIQTVANNQTKTYFSVQIGAFTVADNALKLKEKMETKGYNDVYLKPLDKDGKILHLVHVGHFLNKTEAKQVLQQIKEAEKLPTRLVFTNLEK